MMCLPLPISEYIIYKYPEEAHLPASIVIQKRHEELMKNDEYYAFFNRWAQKYLDYENSD